MATTTKLVELFNAFADASLVDSTATAFVEAAYENLLGLSGDFSNKDARVAYWVEQIEGGVSRADFAATFLAAAAVQGDLLTDAEFAANGVALAAIEALDETDLTLDAVKAAVTVTEEEEEEEANPGETFTLTTGNDAVDGTSGDDTFNADAGTIQVADVITDTSETDNDTLNITMSADADNVAFTANKIENIIVTSDSLSGVNTTVNATNINGLTTITMNAGKAVDGVAEVTNTGVNNVTAGTGVTSLSVLGITGSTVDAGSATTLITNDSATATDVTTAVVNGDVDWTVTTGAAANVKLSATAASVVNLNSTSSLFAGTTVTVTGDNDVTLDSGDELSALTVVDASNATVVVDVDTAGSFDASKWTVDSITVSADQGAAATLTAGSAQTYNITKSQTDLTIDSSAANNAATTVNTGVDSTSITLNTGTSKVATVNITADAEIATLDTAATGKLTVTGSSELTVGQTNAGTLDMSDYTGKTTVTSDAAASVELGSGTNKLTLGNFAYLIAGGEGADTIDAQLIATGTSDVVVASGAGADVVKIDDLGGADLNFNGGAGNDTLWVNAGGTTGAGTVTLTGVEFVEVENQTAGADTSTITMLGANLDEQTLTLKSEDSIDTVTVTVTATVSDTTDLSNIATSNVDKVAINGGDGSAEVILGSTGNDTIEAGTGTASAGDVLTGNAGSDTFVIVSGDSIEAAMDKITDYTATEDKLDLDVTAIEANGSTDVSAAVTGNSETVTANVTDGIMTLSGLTSDRALFDTLAEWVDAAELVATASDVLAFEFNGNTYLFVDGGTQDVIELTGVTGITAVSTTAAADTIQIA